LFDTAAMLKLFGIILAVGGGVILMSMFFHGSSTGSDSAQFTCSQGSYGGYLDCGGWPIFYEGLAKLASKAADLLSFFFQFSLGYVQYVVAAFVLTKFSKRLS